MTKTKFYKFIIQLQNTYKMSNEKIVNLQKLVAQPQCLKLLILHTPYTLQISSLGKCINLVKLDLSKNNLQSFPYIGNLQNLKFMFIHDNKLDFLKFKNIFLKQGEIQQKTPLMKSIIWVTFWGNKNTFLGRHFVANKTNALIFDKHMIVPQQRKQAIISYSQQPFCQKSCVDTILSSNKILGKNATEEQYMDQFWQEMIQLRKKQQQLYPIIKVQKVYRGWIYRQNKKREKQNLLRQLKIKIQFFKSWSLLVKRQKKLQTFLRAKNKEHWLLPLKQMRRQQIHKKMVQLAKKAKLKVLLRKVTLNVQIKFYNVLLANFNMFKSLYQSLQIENSEFILINQSALKSFKKYILPFLQNFNGPDCVTFSTAQNPYEIRQVYDKNSSSRQFIKIISANKRSLVINCTKMLNKKNQNWKKSLLSLNHNYCFMFPHEPLKPLFQKIYLNKSQINKLNKVYSNLVRMDKFHEQQFIIIKGSQRVLKDVVRGVYFFNTKIFGQRQLIFSRIHVFSQISVKQLAAVTYIQKNWRGYIFRKNHKQSIQKAFKMRRAIVKIQRWLRNLSFKHRRNFKYKAQTLIKEITSNVFYVQLTNYYEMLQIQFQRKIDKANFKSKLVKFIQQHAVPYINYTKKIISIFWDKVNSSENINFNKRKIIFDSNYLHKLFKWDQQTINQKFTVDQQMERVELSHLFHFNTMVSTIKAGFKHQYLRIQCQSVSQCKFRILGLLLGSYQFKKSNFIPIYSSELFTSIENIKRKDIINKQAVFVTQGSVILQEGKQKQIQKYECKVKLYLNIATEPRPIKLQESLLIFIPKRQQLSKLQEENIQVKLSKEPKLKMQSFLITEQTLEDSLYKIKPLKNRNRQPKQLAPHQIRKVKIKKSVKSFKMQRKNKQWEPSFLLDNSSIKERLMTQPDMRQVQSKSQIQTNRLQYNSQIKDKVKKDFQIRKNMIKKRKDQDSFTKNFVNLNNFIQHQYLSEQRRRIKTQIQSDSYQSVDRIKLSEAKASQKLIKIKENELKKVHQKHLQHKQLLFRNQAIKKQMTQQLKKIKTAQKQKQNLNKGKNHVRKLKVSFAEQCFPIANRGQAKKYLGRSQSII